MRAGVRAKNIASRKRCDLKTQKRCDVYSAAQKIASDFSAISSAILFCDFSAISAAFFCDSVLCDLKTQRSFSAIAIFGGNTKAKNAPACRGLRVGPSKLY